MKKRKKEEKKKEEEEEEEGEKENQRLYVAHKPKVDPMWLLPLQKVC